MKDGALRRRRLEERSTISWTCTEPYPKRPAHTTRLHGHKENVWRVLALPLESLIVTACVDGRVRVFELNQKKKHQRPLHEFEAHDAAVFDLASLGGEAVVSVGADGRLVVWAVAAGKQVEEFDTKAGVLTAVAAVSHDQLVVGSEAGELLYFRHSGGRKLQRIGRASWAHNKCIGFIATHRNLMVVATLDFSASVWDVDARRKLAYLRNPAPVQCAAISDDIVATCSVNEMRLFSTQAGFPLLKAYRGLGGGAVCFAGEMLLLSSYSDGFITAIRPLAERPVARVKTGATDILSLSIASGERVAWSDCFGNCELVCLRNMPEVASALKSCVSFGSCNSHERNNAWLLGGAALLSIAFFTTVRLLR